MNRLFLSVGEQTHDFANRVVAATTHRFVDVDTVAHFWTGDPIVQAGRISGSCTHICAGCYARVDELPSPKVLVLSICKPRGGDLLKVLWAFLNR